MKLTQKDVEEIRTILAACKVIGVEGVVLTNEHAGALRPDHNAAVISSTQIKFADGVSLGIGRVAELEKRLNVFQGEVEIEGKVNDAGQVALLTLSSGRSKIQFRCTAATLMKDPKANHDPTIFAVTLNKLEAQTLTRAAKTLGAERIMLQVGRNGEVRFECAGAESDKFDVQLSSPAEFIDEAVSEVFAYGAGLAGDVIDAAVKEGDEFTLLIGETGSLTTTIKGKTVVVFALID